MIQDPTTFPKAMVHPAHSKGIQGRPATMNKETGQFNADAIQGTPCRFPPIQAATKEEEDFYRAKGYLVDGEKAAAVVGYTEYPKMLVHPEHVDAVPDQLHAHKETSDGPTVMTVVKGVPEKFPHAIVNSREEETAWNIKGYEMPRLPDPQAVERSRANPYDPDRKISDYPKMVNGVLIQDPKINTSGIQEFPKWIGDKLVNSAEEEIELLGNHGVTDAQIESILMERRAASERDDDVEVTRIELLLMDQGIEVKDKPHGTVWRRLPKESAEIVSKTDDGGFTQVSAEIKVPLSELEDRNVLLALAEQNGIKVDKRWNADKIRAALTEAA
jgi:hypothetical protein